MASAHAGTPPGFAPRGLAREGSEMHHAGSRHLARPRAPIQVICAGGILGLVTVLASALSAVSGPQSVALAALRAGMIYLSQSAVPEETVRRPSAGRHRRVLRPDLVIPVRARGDRSRGRQDRPALSRAVTPAGQGGPAAAGRCFSADDMPLRLTFHPGRAPRA